MAYFPNGCAGEHLENQCAECVIGKHHDAPCPVLLQSLMFNYDQCKEGQEKLKDSLNYTIDEKGDCQMKKVLDEYLPPSDGKLIKDIKAITSSMLNSDGMVKMVQKRIKV